MSMIPPTINGYNYLEVVSTLQKAIRRGDEEHALFFATEVILSGKDEALWRRLKVITSEDVGLAALSAPAIIESLHAGYKEAKKQKKDSKPERLMIFHAVLFLCRSKKSRLVDWAVNAYFPNHGEDLIQIPDYAFDMHTLKGRQQGKGLSHFVSEGCRLENHKKQPLEDAYMKKALIALQKKKFKEKK